MGKRTITTKDGEKITIIDYEEPEWKPKKKRLSKGSYKKLKNTFKSR
jgi:hypothetical protein